MRPNYLSGIYGGISTTQWQAIQSISGVSVAAPIAMIGYTSAFAYQDVDLTSAVNKAGGDQLFRVTPTWVTDAGLTHIPDDPQYVYVTRDKLLAPLNVGGDPRFTQYPGGITVPTPETCRLPVLQIRPDGTRNQICRQPSAGLDAVPFQTERSTVMVARLLPDGEFQIPEEFDVTTSKTLVTSISWTVMLLTAAIDPASEAELVGLDKAVVSGHYLTDGDADKPQQPANAVGPTVPIMSASHIAVDDQVSIGVEAMGAGGAPDVSGATADIANRLRPIAGTKTGVAVHTGPNIPLITRDNSGWASR